jgi:hypothetical protein
MAASEVSDSEKGDKRNGELVEEDQLDGSQAGEDEEPEYEIEKILKAKMGHLIAVRSIFLPPSIQIVAYVVFQGQMAYFVKWKGYDDSENSWVNQDDAGYVTDATILEWPFLTSAQECGGPYQRLLGKGETEEKAGH